MFDLFSARSSGLIVFVVLKILQQIPIQTTKTRTNAYSRNTQAAWQLQLQSTTGRTTHYHLMRRFACCEINRYINIFCPPPFPSFLWSVCLNFLVFLGFLQPGSFLVRHSRSNPNAVVIAYHESNGNVEQCLVEAATAGTEPPGFYLNTFFFRSVEDIIAANPGMLKFNLGNVESEPEPCDEKPVDGHEQGGYGQAVVVASTSDAEHASRFCSVCLDSFETVAVYAMIPCGHVFCENCVSRLEFCAMCRSVNNNRVRIFI